MERLGELGLLDRTLIAIVGDHGESLGDHGEETHTMFVYESAIRVPLILWRPGLLPAGVVVREPVRLTDLAPTLLDLGGRAAAHDDARAEPAAADREPLGRSGAADLRRDVRAAAQHELGAAPIRPRRAVEVHRGAEAGAVRPGVGPGETRNVHDERQQTVRGLAQALTQLTGGTTGAQNVGALDRETLEKLASLGYVGAGAEPVPTAGGAARPDPKDMIAVYNRLRRANSAVRERRFDEALPIFRAVLAKDARNAFALFMLGNALKDMSDFRGAIVAVPQVPGAAAGERECPHAGGLLLPEPRRPPARGHRGGRRARPSTRASATPAS